jgi:hypothetical protein
MPRGRSDVRSTGLVAALVARGTLHVEDSCTVARVWSDGRVITEDLSWDQTPPASLESGGAGRRRRLAGKNGCHVRLMHLWVAQAPRRRMRAAYESPVGGI